MSFEIELLARDIVKKHFTAQGYTLTDLAAVADIAFAVEKNGVREFYLFVDDQQYCLLNRTECHFINLSKLERLKHGKDFCNTTIKICFVDFLAGIVHYDDLDILEIVQVINDTKFPVENKGTGYRYWALDQFGYRFRLGIPDLSKYMNLRINDFNKTDEGTTLELPPLCGVDKKNAAQILIDLHKQKLGTMQAEFENMIRGLIKD